MREYQFFLIKVSIILPILNTFWSTYLKLEIIEAAELMQVHSGFMKYVCYYVNRRNLTFKLSKKRTSLIRKAFVSFRYVFTHY